MTNSSSSDSDSDVETRQEAMASKPPAYTVGAQPIPYPTGTQPMTYPAPYPQQYQAYPQPGAIPPPTGVVHQAGYYTTNAQGQQVYVSQVTKMNTNTYDDLRGAIPIMPMPLAIFCCVINFCLPGFGTMIASFSVFCCANIGQSTSDKVGCFCMNFWIGWLQLFTVWIFLFGWIWSIIWGWAFVAASAEYHSRPREGTTTTVITETPVSYHNP